MYLGLARNVRDHPIDRMLHAGIPVTVNAEDPLFFRTTLLDELAVVREILGLADADLAAMTLAGTRASGASASVGDRINSGVATWLGTPPQHDGGLP
jgi:adenosine deaminase